MTAEPLFYFLWEDFTASIYYTHIISLYIEDEWVDELVEVRVYPTPNYSAKVLRNKTPQSLNQLLALFSDIDGFWNALDDQYRVHVFGRRCDATDLEKSYGTFIGHKLLKEFQILFKGKDYTDNFRVAIKGNVAEEKTYWKAKQNGCCGYVDEVVIVDGVEYLVGFNWGH